MADAIVSKLLDELVNVSIRKIEEETKLVLGVRDEVNRLAHNLRKIKAVLADAESRQHKKDELTESIMLWLQELKNVAYDMDDVLDEWSTAILKSKIQAAGDEHADDDSMPMKRMICPFSCFSCFGNVAQQHHTAQRIKDLNKRLDEIALRKDGFNLLPSVSNNTQLPRLKTTSRVYLPEIKGRDTEKSEVIGMLLRENHGSPLPPVSIVGMGGLGKTTLARLVYNDPEVQTHFEKTIWVCVSDPFEEIKIAKAILDSLKGSVSESTDQPELIVQQLEKEIGEKRFLLVLDDVWNTSRLKWEQLNSYLPRGSPGSKILVTTRNTEVARVAGCACTGIDIFQLEKLTDDKCWEIFCHVAMKGDEDEKRKRTVEFRERILENCKGLPLAVKTLAGLLKDKTTPTEWRRILWSDMWKEGDVFSSLWLSYYDLPPVVRQCFSYCAIFPKDYPIRKDQLIEMWMAQGYLKETEDTSMETVGEEYFQHLASQSFFQDFDQLGLFVPHDEFIMCKMHDIVHDFAELVSRNECFVVETTSTEEAKTDNLHEEARHGTVIFKRGTSFPGHLLSRKQLRSLAILPDRGLDIKELLAKLFGEFTCLRSLDLTGDGHCVREMPSTISRLIHLRRLSLRGNETLEELPLAVCDLYNLQTLDMRGCERLWDLPDKMGNLINLRHLHTHRGTHMPKSIGKLTGLRTLTFLRITSKGRGNSSRASICDLKNMNQLHGELWILGLISVTKEDIEEAQKVRPLKKKQAIAGLKLNFAYEWDGSMYDKMETADHDALIEALEPCPNLEELHIGSFEGTSFPSWMMSMTHLRKVALSWFSCVSLPPLGKLPFLETLILKGMREVEKLGAELLGAVQTSTATAAGDKYEISSSSPSRWSTSVAVAFPKLTVLKFSLMHKWEGWDDAWMISSDQEDTSRGSHLETTILPCLRSLHFYDCPKLKALPHQLLGNKTLEVLDIRHCPILAERYQEETGEDWLKISHIPNINIGITPDGIKPQLLYESATEI